MNLSDRRGYLRTSVETNGTCCLQNLDTRQVFRAEIIDVSATGIRLKINKVLKNPPGVKAKLAVLVNDLQIGSIPLEKMTLQVVWVQGLEFGCRFAPPG